MLLDLWGLFDSYFGGSPANKIFIAKDDEILLFKSEEEVEQYKEPKKKKPKPKVIKVAELQDFYDRRQVIKLPVPVMVLVENEDFGELLKLQARMRQAQEDEELLIIMGVL